jgi:RimJ/RimL family protein N-acetyltransferase/tRNA1(Val) A37 N6-methylase TrmN6
MKYVGSRQVWSNEKLNRFIDYCIQEKNTNNSDNLYFKIVKSGNGVETTKKFIGIIGIHRSDKNSDFELTYYIHKAQQGKGFGSEALQLMLDKFHKEHPKVKRILSDTLTYNKAAQKSLQKNGFMFLKNVNRSGKKYARFEYVFKYYKILQYKYPYLSHFITKKECLARFEELKTLKFDQLSKTNRTIVIDYAKDQKYNQITDYFTNPCRMDCVFKGNMSPLEYYRKNKGKVLKNSLKAGKFDYLKFEDYMYRKSNMCNNFQITIIMNIYAFFKPKRILDSSAGWGDRLVAAMASDVKYVGVDPSKCLKPLYPKIIKGLNGDADRFQIINKPFEKITEKDIEETFDLAFTSPPFWDVEVYNSENENQSIMSYSDEDSWVKGFLNKLADINISYLKKGGHLVIYVPEYTGFMEYMSKRKDIKRLEDIKYHYSDDSKKRRTILVWKKI